MQQASCRPAGPARRSDAASAAHANNEAYLQHNLSHGLHGIETAGEITVAGLWLGLDMSQYSKRRVTPDQERLGGSETFSDLLGLLERSLRFAHCAGCRRFAFGEWSRTIKGAGISGRESSPSPALPTEPCSSGRATLSLSTRRGTAPIDPSWSSRGLKWRHTASTSDCLD